MDPLSGAMVLHCHAEAETLRRCVGSPAGQAYGGPPGWRPRRC